MPDILTGTPNIDDLLGSPVRSARILAGGDIAEVSHLTLADGRDVVTKRARAGGPASGLVEARMLRYLATHSTLPVPQVLHAASDLIIIEYLPSGDPMTALAETDLARHIAALHQVRGTGFGLDFDTVIGPLAQPNPVGDNWGAFFRDQRLLYMADLALEAGRLDTALRHRIDRLAARLDDLIIAPSHPMLLHGDLWGGNILVKNDRISGFIDPAISYGHGEMDLAFATLFGTVGEPFFKAYEEITPLEPGFFEARRELYNLWPLLVHVRLFGGSYVGSVMRIVERFGC